MIAGTTAVGQFLIATPTKCGTTTVEALANRHARQKGKAARGGFRLVDWEVGARRQHRMVAPDGWEDATPFMLVRNPFSRYTSVYEYLRAPANYSQWGAKKVQGREWPGERPDPRWIKDDPLPFEEFMLWMSDVRSFLSKNSEITRRGGITDPRAFRSPWVWTDSLALSHEIYTTNMGRPPALLRLENLWGDLGKVRDTFMVRELDLSPLHSNRTTTRHVEAGREEPANKGDGEVWLRYYGGEHSLCGPRVGTGKCKFRDRWEDERCPVCRMGVHEEAALLGY